MPWSRTKSLIFLFAALVISAALLDSAMSAAGAPQATTASLAGQLLVAAPGMQDPRFDHTVILVVRHDADGALGIVINLPGEERSLASILDSIGVNDPEAEGSAPVFAGGPVQPEVGFVVHTTDYHRPATIDIDGRVAVTATPEILRDIAHKRGPAKSLIAFGYAGWTAGQLEGEIALHAWATTLEDPKLVFDADRDKLWDLAWARRSVDL